MGLTISGEDWLWLVFGTLGFAVAGFDLRRRKLGGAVLLDLGGRIRPADYLVAIVLLFAFLLTRIRFHATIGVAVYGFLGLLASSVIGATRRFQIREGGMVGRGGKLTQWRQIEGYELSPAGTLSLKIRSKGWTFFCNLPVARHSAVEEVLAPRCTAGAA